MSLKYMELKTANEIRLRIFFGQKTEDGRPKIKNRQLASSGSRLRTSDFFLRNYPL